MLAHGQVGLASVISNAVLYQAGWFACVLGAAHGMPWVGAAAALLIVGWHLARAANARREFALVAAAAGVGAAFETALVQAGWVHFPSGTLLEGIAPYWMVALWALFATTLNVSLRTLRSRPVLGAALGLAGAPAAYYAGSRLGALELTSAGAALATIAIGWALLAPMLLALASRIDGYTTP